MFTATSTDLAAIKIAAYEPGIRTLFPSTTTAKLFQTARKPWVEAQIVLRLMQTASQMDPRVFDGEIASAHASHAYVQNKMQGWMDDALLAAYQLGQLARSEVAAFEIPEFCVPAFDAGKLDAAFAPA